MEELVPASTNDESDATTNAVLRTAAARARAKGQPITILHDGRRLRIFANGRTEDAGPAPSETSAQLAARLEMAKPAKFELRDIGNRPASRKNDRMAAPRRVRTDKVRSAVKPAEPAEISDSKINGVGEVQDAQASEPASEMPPNTAEKVGRDELTAAASGAAEYNLKIVAAACANTKNMLQFTGELMRAKTLADMLEVSSAYARKQMEAGTEQARDLAVAAQKIAPKNPDDADK